VQASDAEMARQMMHGEYESQKALHDFVPSFIPKPINWGTYTDKRTYFFLSEFIEMTGNIPPPPKFCAKLAELHLKSMQKSSPGGKFGFHLDTCQGNILLTKGWCDTWEKYFLRTMEEMIKREQFTQGPCPEIDKLQKPLVEKVIPRLLRPLESNGRSIRPCLVHGDLWHGNASTSSDTNEPYAFDSCALWAHNECT
jgi:protein-ribulosamine 3-kinase